MFKARYPPSTIRARAIGFVGAMYILSFLARVVMYEKITIIPPKNTRRRASRTQKATIEEVTAPTRIVIAIIKRARIKGCEDPTIIRAKEVKNTAVIPSITKI